MEYYQISSKEDWDLYTQWLDDSAYGEHQGHPEKYICFVLSKYNYDTETWNHEFIYSDQSK